MDTLQSILVNTLVKFPKFDTKERHQGIPSDTKVLNMGIPIVKSHIRKQKYNIFGIRLLKHLDVNCSYGLGRHWASIPWISIYNPQQYIGTPSATKGVYLAYLFSNNLKNVYLSLNMGTTRFSKAYQKRSKNSTSTINNEILSEISSYAKYLRIELFKLYKNNSGYNSTLLTKLNNPITLKDKTLKKDKSKRSDEYERGNILSIRYSLPTLKDMNNSSKLMTDLTNMASIYDNLMYKVMPRNSFIKNDIEYRHTLSNKESELNGRAKVYKGSLNKNSDKIKEKYNAKLNKAKHGKHTANHSKRSKELAKLGDGGEKFVVKHELHKLEKYAPKLATSGNVHQVSATDTRKGNNALGYDVISRNIDGSKLHIEVKTTSVNDLHRPFDISFNEVQFAKKFINNDDDNHQPKNYRLYRLFNAKHGKRVKILTFSPIDIVKMAQGLKYHQINSYIFFI